MAKSNSSQQPIELDGRTLEGGGQLLRIAICLSALTSIPVKITDIRGNRSGGGGLKAQHLASVNWLAQACNARVAGAERGSKTLLFEPNAARLAGQESSNVPSIFRKKRLPDRSTVWEARLDIGTAGSTGLALQAILPFILFTSLPSDGEDLSIHLTLSGGTNVSGSPSYDYITQVLLPTLESIGFSGMNCTLGKRGWSHGGSSIGNFTLTIPRRSTLPLPAFKMLPHNGVESSNPGPTRPCQLTATFIAPASTHAHFRERLKSVLQAGFDNSALSQTPIPTEVTCEDSKHDKRMYFLLVAKITNPLCEHNDSVPFYYLGRDWLYDRKIVSHTKATEAMVSKVVRDLGTEWRSGAFVDEHMRDQLAVFRALAEGRSEVFPGVEVGEGGEREPSLHARTAEWVCREMLGVRFDEEGACEGVGFGARGPEDAVLDGEGAEDLEKAMEELQMVR